ncbi:MAG TPA: hypothetical protein VFQ61_15465 [Polyangiaceae bacterium]|nr:hypothetical protein [Polyangiaceae bacterium]
MREKVLPEAERVAIAAEIRELLALRDQFGRRYWTQASLGEACGGLSQQVIYLAQQPNRVGPAVRDALLQVLKVPMSQLLEKHRPLIDAPEEKSTARKKRGEPSGKEKGKEQIGNPRTAPRGGPAPLPARVLLDPLEAYRKVMEALQEDGYEQNDIRLVLAQVAFEFTESPSIPGTAEDILRVYRAARGMLEPQRRARGSSKQGSASGVRVTKSRRRVG